MTEEILKKQSTTAYKQWCEQWRDHASKHYKIENKSLDYFENKGIGKTILLVANGYSLEENMPTIINNKDNVDILCCDKTLGHLLDHGIKPKYCLVCDANVDYDKYMDKYKDQLDQTVLFINACANPKWSFNGNWKDRYVFVNKDIINSHEEFSRLSGCTNFIPAGTNVSNAMLVFITQSDNNGRRNYFGYDKILLIGFDYSWNFNGKYYAYDNDGNGKNQYMRHAYFTTRAGKSGYSSGNLIFSKDWIEKYISTFNLPVVQCSKDSLLQLKASGDLKHHINYRHKVGDSKVVISNIKQINELSKKLEALKNETSQIGKDHWHSYLKSI